MGRGQQSIGVPGYVPTFREELTRATAAAIADVEVQSRLTPIHAPLREMGFSDRHISQVRARLVNVGGNVVTIKFSLVSLAVLPNWHFVAIWATF